MKKNAIIKSAQETLRKQAEAAEKRSAIIDACELCNGNPSECGEFPACQGCPQFMVPAPDISEVLSAEESLRLVALYDAMSESDRVRLAEIPLYASDWRSVQDIRERLSVSWSNPKQFGEWARFAEV